MKRDGFFSRLLCGNFCVKTVSGSRLFMHFVVSETSTSEVDKAGRILIPGRLRKHINLDDDQEIVLVGMYEHLEVWGPTEWRRYVARTQERHEASMSKIMDIL